MSHDPAFPVPDVFFSFVPAVILEMHAKGFSHSLCTTNTDSGIAMIIG
jgi:hypothetical protein